MDRSTEDDSTTTGSTLADDATVFEEAARLVRAGQPAALCTVVRAVGSTPRGLGARMVVYPDGQTLGTIGGGALERQVALLAADATHEAPQVVDYDLGRDLDMSCGGEISVLIEPLGNSPQLVLFGAGHIAQVLAPMAATTGFRVSLVDDLPKYANEARFPDAAQLIHSFDPDDWTALALDERTYCVILTRDHSQDLAVLRSLVERDLAYLGMIGSQSKVAASLAALRAEGVAEERLAQVFAPIGLDIGSETPEEIAISILAQLIQVRRGTRS